MPIMSPDGDCYFEEEDDPFDEDDLTLGTVPTRFRPYVFSVHKRAGAGVVHTVAGIRLGWYAWDGEDDEVDEYIVRLVSPLCYVDCVCGDTFFPSSVGRLRFCEQPPDDRPLCRRCLAKTLKAAADG